jgi:hypothetical protein
MVALMLGCADPQPTQPAEESIELPERVAILMGGWPHAKAITETGKATAYRITYEQGDPDTETLGPAITLTPKQRSELVSLLARDDAYEWDIAKGCMPMPGILITFEDGATYARVRLCYSCRMVGYRPGSWEDFDPINEPLIDWAKGVFPEDEAIQSLGTAGAERGL